MMLNCWAQPLVFDKKAESSRLTGNLNPSVENVKIKCETIYVLFVKIFKNKKEDEFRQKISNKRRA